ncbi:hypothetical protein HYT33_04515 [Candidatus Roizmanbacteria bacterium]|nr:hypothetical protein [Candidatus Roizmanbacteria bacterium]
MKRNSRQLKISISHNIIFVLVFILFVIFLGVGWVVNANRYYLQSSGGVTYKIDRWTGKTWIITSDGEVEVPSEAPTPSPTEAPKEFPISELEIISTRGVPGEPGWDGYVETVVRNNHYATAKNIEFKVTYTDDQSGPIKDTRYYTYETGIKGGDTITIKVPLKSSAIEKQYWFTVEVASAIEE